MRAYAHTRGALGGRISDEEEEDEEEEDREASSEPIWNDPAPPAACRRRGRWAHCTTTVCCDAVFSAKKEFSTN